MHPVAAALYLAAPINHTNSGHGGSVVWIVIVAVVIVIVGGVGFFVRSRRGK